MKEGGHGLETTVQFLRSGLGVKQALFLAGWELREIRTDRWGDEVWGVTPEGGGDNNDRGAREETRSPALYFWFAKEDHWVANVTRDEILSKRGEKKDHQTTGQETEGRTRHRPRILVDDGDGLVHAWCLDQSEMVAERVGDWLEEVLAKDG
jgi:hypothetical protein